MDFLFSHGMRGEPRKQTEIGEIPESWEVVQLKEIANLRRENVKPADNQNLNFVGLEHIDSGESILKRWGNASAMKSAKNHFYPNLMFCMVNCELIWIKPLSLKWREFAQPIFLSLLPTQKQHQDF